MKKIVREDFIATDITDDDVIEAMKKVGGYIDITPGDFRELYQFAYDLAVTRLLASMTAGRIMNGPVVLLDQKLELIDAARLLAAERVSGAPVVDTAGLIVGVVSEKDFLEEMGFGESPSFMQIATHCLGNNSCMISRLHGRTVGDIMSSPPIMGTGALTLAAIAEIFTEQRINRLPIVDEAGRPIGIVTRTDLAHAFHLPSRRAK